VNPVSQVLPQGVEYIRILPEIVLTVFGAIIMLLDPLLDEKGSRKTLGAIGLLGAIAAMAATVYQAQFPGLAFWGMVNVDSFSVFFHLLVTAVATVVILTSYEYMTVQQIRAGEY
jgi:NADH-quinone oxidoreductase subunit N